MQPAPAKRRQMSVERLCGRSEDEQSDIASIMDAYNIHTATECAIVVITSNLVWSSLAPHSLSCHSRIWHGIALGLMALSRYMNGRVRVDEGLGANQC